MKKSLKRFIIGLIIFCAALGVALVGNWLRNKQSVSYTAMKKASLPVVHLTYRDGCSTRLHGYRDEMDYRTMRAEITPLLDRRRMTVSIDTYGREFSQIIYQLRSLDGERLVEDGILDKWTEQDGIMTQELQLAGLMEDGQEYILMLMLTSGDEKIRYYSRVVYMKEGNTERMIDFVHEFSAATFARNSEFIINYIQPNETMGTEDLSYINLHSRYAMFTWMDLTPVVTGTVETSIYELSDSQMTAILNYPISVEYGDMTKRFSVEETFVVRYRNDTMYLLDYDRYMTEPFSVSNMSFDGGNIWLGVTAQKSAMTVSPNQTIYAFEYQGQLWTYDSKTETISFVFSYQDGDEERSRLAHHSIEIVRVTDDGDVDFIVYGYHNRGTHEGQVGVCFYRYYKEERRMEELFYIPSTSSEEVLQAEMGGLAYVSDTDLLYFLYGNTIYSLDLASKERMELATQEYAGSFYRNDDSSLVAWHAGTAGRAEQIVIMNLENGKIFRILANEGEYVEIQGFIGTDIVYGIGKLSDVGMLSGTQEVSPLYMLCFATIDDELTESGSYRQSGILILQTEIDENMVEMVRVRKSGAFYEPIENDQVFLNLRTDPEMTGMMESKQTDGFLKANYIRLGISVGDMVYERDQSRYLDKGTDQVLTLDSLPVSQADRYYVYGKGHLLGIENELAKAIDMAYDVMGCVVNADQKYLWTRGTRDLYKYLTLEQAVCESESLSLERCIGMFLSYEGAGGWEVEEALRGGRSAFEILNERMDGKVLDLGGCSVAQVLYYLHMGHPVLAQTGTYSAVLITGYETKGITLYNPYGGVVSEMTMEEAERYFGGLGYRFISCQ